MVLPTQKMIYWWALVACSGGVLVLTDTTGQTVALLISIIWLAYLTTDYLRSRPNGDDISIQMKAVQRIMKGKESHVSLMLNAPGLEGRVVSLGLPLPAHFDVPEQGIVVKLTTKSSLSLIRYPCTPQRRGSYSIEVVYIEIPSLWGMWKIRRKVTAQSEIRVFPDITAYKHLMQAFLTQRTIPGVRLQRQVGRGREFDCVRAYLPGDPYDSIHWKVSAKRGIPVTKVFRLERTQDVYVVIDHGRLSARALDFRDEENSDARETRLHHTFLEGAVSAALVMTQVVTSNGDNFGLITHADHVTQFLKARSGSAHQQLVVDALVTVKSRNESPDFTELCATITTRVRRRALLIFLTNLDDRELAKQFMTAVRIVQRKHLTVAALLWPPDAKPLFSSARENTVQALYEEMAGHLLWKQMRELIRSLRRYGVHALTFDNQSLVPELVTHYLRVKKRQMI